MTAGFWVAISVMMALQLGLLDHDNAEVAMRFAATQLLPWAFLTPLIIWLSSVFTLEKGRRQRTVWTHLAACVAISILLGVLSYRVGPKPVARRVAPASPASALREPLPPRRVILRRATFQLPVYWAIVGVAHAFLFYERAKARERRATELAARLAQARLQTLQMQLNPHFLFNTLNSIASLVHENPQAADEMITSLSDFLRLTLKLSDRQEVTLREELDFLDHYLAIEQVRFGDRLRVEKQVEPAVLDALVPVLVLQPLVENAIKHGIEEQSAPGVVRITATQTGDTLHLRVADNGRGISEDERFKEGLGLVNTRARLKELAGIAASLKLHTPPEGGFVAELQLPCRPAIASLMS